MTGSKPTYAFGFLDCFGKRWNHFEEIADDAVVDDFKDRPFFILVDGDDGFRSCPEPTK